MTHRALRSVWLLAASCAPASQPPPPITIVKPPAPVAPARVKPCQVAGAWSVTQPHKLRLHPDGATFAIVHQPEHAVLTLTDAAATVKLSSPQVHIEGFVPPEAVTLHMSRPFLVAGYLAPGPKAGLRWLGSKHVEVILPAHVRAIVPARTTVACSDLALDVATTFRARDTIADASERTVMLDDAKPISLAAVPAGPPIAELTYTAGEGPLVDVIQQRGPDVQIVVLNNSFDPAADLVVVGWVPETLLRPHTHGFGGSWSSGREPRMPMVRRTSLRKVTCPHHVPISVDFAGERQLVGAFAANVEIEVLDDADPVSVYAPTAQIELADGARLVTRRAGLADCTP